jgi:hypothetical protein
MNYIIKPNSITVYVGGNVNTINVDNPLYTKVKNAVKNGDEKALKRLLTAPIQRLEQRGFSFKNNRFFWNGEEVNNVVTERISDLARNGFDTAPMAKFLKNVLENPNPESVKDLYRFLEKNDLPITTDGCFLAYKRVNPDYTDCYTGTISNKIGAKVPMPREEVTFDPNLTCERGLHVCTRNYLSSFTKDGGHLMIIKINPKDVVSVPVDYDGTKMRVCYYEVVDEIVESKPIAEYTGNKPVVNYSRRDKLGRFQRKTAQTAPKRDKFGRFLKK